MPRTVIFRLSQGESLGDTMGRMRRWLDREKIQLTAFATNVDAKGLVISLGFFSDGDADRFRAQFGAVC